MRHVQMLCSIAAVLALSGCPQNGGPKHATTTVASTTAEASATAKPVIPAGEKARILVVSSYHREYLWSQDTNKGVCEGLKKFGYFDSVKDAETFWKNDAVETSKAHVKKLWMDTKRKGSDSHIASAVKAVMVEYDSFKPHIVLLGDDNAANYVGNQLLDRDTPVVFWGINGLPLKYGLIDTVEKPGHNVTGVYQAGYLRECVDFLTRIVPGVKTMAILSDDSPTGRAKVQQLKQLSEEEGFPVTIVGTVTTNSEKEWKDGAKDLAAKADSFFVFNHNTVKDSKGNTIDQMTLGAWYLNNVKKPDCGHERQFAQEGLLATADDSGFNQGMEAIKLMHDIVGGRSPSAIPVRAPSRGPLIVNRQRATMLGLKVTEDSGVEEWIDTAMALKKGGKPGS